MAGIELNIQAPDFTLNAFEGRSVTISSFFGQKNVLVVFNRGFF